MGPHWCTRDERNYISHTSLIVHFIISVTDLYSQLFSNPSFSSRRNSSLSLSSPAMSTPAMLSLIVQSCKFRLPASCSEQHSTHGDWRAMFQPTIWLGEPPFSAGAAANHRLIYYIILLASKIKNVSDLSVRLDYLKGFLFLRFHSSAERRLEPRLWHRQKAWRQYRTILHYFEATLPCILFLRRLPGTV